MTLIIPSELMFKLRAHAETSYPDEGAGLLLGRALDDIRIVESISEINNAREPGARHNRYLITPQDMLRAEDEAALRGMDVLGVFHSHPDHPARPSEFDRQWAMPWFSYLITSVEAGATVESRSWRLAENRESFSEEPIEIRNFAPLPHRKASSKGGISKG